MHHEVRRHAQDTHAIGHSAEDRDPESRVMQGALDRGGIARHHDALCAGLLRVEREPERKRQTGDDPPRIGRGGVERERESGGHGAAYDGLGWAQSGPRLPGAKRARKD